ncbi:hypothetical protein CJF32_00009446 [Rutstroemia sp. NJR-2017a WRK4]|nr:hypothetical protein CJF32_00009446 [Rutstroemia sp. NJR-2017a WRK4]
MAAERLVHVFEVWTGYGDTGVIQEGVLAVPLPRQSSRASSSDTASSSSSWLETVSSSSETTPIEELLPSIHYFHTTYTTSIQPFTASTQPKTSKIDGRSVWQGTILSSSLPQYLQICSTVKERHNSVEEKKLLKKSAEWTKMCFLDIARSGLWVDSVVSRMRDSREEERQVRRVNRVLGRDEMMLRRLRRRMERGVGMRGRESRRRSMGRIVLRSRRNRGEGLRIDRAPAPKTIASMWNQIATEIHDK